MRCHRMGWEQYLPGRRNGAGQTGHGGADVRGRMVRTILGQNSTYMNTICADDKISCNCSAVFQCQRWRTAIASNYSAA